MLILIRLQDSQTKVHGKIRHKNNVHLFMISMKEFSSFTLNLFRCLTIAASENLGFTLAASSLGTRKNVKLLIGEIFLFLFIKYSATSSLENNTFETVYRNEIMNVPSRAKIFIRIKAQSFPLPTIIS